MSDDDNGHMHLVQDADGNLTEDTGDDCGCYTATFTAAELGMVASALENHYEYLNSHGQLDYAADELDDAKATCLEALLEVTTLIGG